MRPERIQNPESEDAKTLVDSEPLLKITDALTYFRTLRDEAEGEALVSREYDDIQRRDRLAAIVLELEKVQGFVAYQLT